MPSYGAVASAPPAARAAGALSPRPLLYVIVSLALIASPFILHTSYSSISSISSLSSSLLSPLPTTFHSSTAEAINLSISPAIPSLVHPHGGTLDFGTYHFKSSPPATIPLRSYGSAPTIIFHTLPSPLVVNFTNNLRPLPPHLLNTPPEPASVGISQANSPDYLDTNLHLHGYHGPFISDHDNIHAIFSPNTTHTIKYPFPPASPHSMWLHPHLEGTSSHDITSSFTAPGAILYLVDPTLPRRWLDRESLTLPIVLSTLNVATGKSRSLKGLAKISNVKLSDELPPLTQVSLDPPAYYLTAGVTYTGDLATAMAILGRSVTLVNGVIAPNYPMGVSDAHDGRMRGLRRVRVTGATVGDVVNVEFGGVADGQCGFWSVSRDGVFFETPRRVDGSLLVPPGGRVDVIMQCVDVTVGDTVTVSSLGWTPPKPPKEGFVGVKSDVDKPEVLFRVTFTESSGSEYDDGVAAVDVEDLDLSPLIPDYIKALKKNTDVPRLFDFNYTNGAGKDPAGLSEYGVNGGAGNSRTVCLDLLESWRVIADASMARASHPFHMHVNHFQVTEVVCWDEGGKAVACEGNTDFEIGDVRDSIIVPSPGFARIKFLPHAYAGKGALAHCHIFGHEEMGMVMNIDIGEGKEQCL